MPTRVALRHGCCILDRMGCRRGPLSQTSMTPHHEIPGRDHSATVVSELVRHAGELIRAEAELARDEFVEEARRVRRGVALLLIGTATAQCGVLFLGVSLPVVLGVGTLEIALIAATIIATGVLTMLFAWLNMARPCFERTRRRLTELQPLPEETLP